MNLFFLNRSFSLYSSLIHFLKLLAAKAASSTTRPHVLISKLLLVVSAISLLIYLILELLSATLVLLNVVEYPLAEFLVPILIIE
jgi:hypothetical protein